MTSPLQEYYDPQLDDYLVTPELSSPQSAESTPETPDMAQTPLLQSAAWKDLLQVAGVLHSFNYEKTVQTSLKPPIEPPPSRPTENTVLSLSVFSPVVDYSHVANDTPSPDASDTSAIVSRSPEIHEVNFEPYHDVPCPGNASNDSCRKHDPAVQCSDCASWPQAVTDLVSEWRGKNYPYSIIARYVSDMRGVKTTAGALRKRYAKPSRSNQVRSRAEIRFSAPRRWTQEADDLLVALRDDPKSYSWAEVARRVSEFRGVKIGASTAFNRYWKTKDSARVGHPPSRSRAPTDNPRFRQAPFKRFVGAKLRK